jgi:hypothetical protein
VDRAGGECGHGGRSYTEDAGAGRRAASLRYTSALPAAFPGASYIRPPFRPWVEMAKRKSGFERSVVERHPFLRGRQPAPAATRLLTRGQLLLAFRPTNPSRSLCGRAHTRSGPRVLPTSTAQSPPNVPAVAACPSAHLRCAWGVPDRSRGWPGHPNTRVPANLG